MGKKELGLFVLVLVIGAITTALNPRFLSAVNLLNMANLIGLFGVFSIGQGLVIITGGIDLSVGSVFALLGVVFIDLLANHDVPWPLALLFVLAGGLLTGAVHGVLVTRAKLQPFVVTLCGLLIYRGAARYYTGDATIGFGYAEGLDSLTWLASGRSFGVPNPFLILVVVAVVMAVVLHRSVFGRYLFAVGRNEEAARYSGIRTGLVVAGAYIVSGGLAGLSTVLLVFYTNSVSPSAFGSFYELRMDPAILLDRCIDLVRKIVTLRRKRRMVHHLRRQRRQFAQRRRGKHVGRNEERVDTRVIRRAKHRIDQPHRSCRVAIPAQWNRVRRDRTRTLKVIWPRPVLALLNPEGCDDQAHRLRPLRVERRRVPSRLPVRIVEPYAEAQRIDLPLALGHPRLVVRKIVHAPRERLRRRRVGQKSIGIRVKLYAAGLPMNQPNEQLLQLAVLRDQRYIRPHLARGVAKPHRIDVARNHKRVRLASQRAQIDCCVESIGVAVLKHVRQLRIAYAALHPLDQRLNCRRRKLASRARRPTLPYTRLLRKGPRWNKAAQGGRSCSLKDTSTAGKRSAEKRKRRSRIRMRSHGTIILSKSVDPRHAPECLIPPLRHKPTPHKLSHNSPGAPCPASGTWVPSPPTEQI